MDVIVPSLLPFCVKEFTDCQLERLEGGALNERQLQFHTTSKAEFQTCLDQWKTQ